MLSPEFIERVQISWAELMPISDKAIMLFYGRLFDRDPEVGSLLKSAMEAHREQVMAMITKVVGSLDDLEKIVPAVDALGRRLSVCGVVDEHYVAVGDALLWALKHALGDAFTPQVKAAWVEVYGALAQTVRDAAARAAA